MPPLIPRSRARFAIAAMAVLFLAGAAAAHDAEFPVEGRKVIVRTDAAKEARKFVFKAVDDLIRAGSHDPTVDGAALVVNGFGDTEEGTGFIRLKAQKWFRKLDDQGAFKAYKFVDEKGKAGGVIKAVLKDGVIRIVAKGKNWTWKPDGPQDDVWVHFRTEEEGYCARFGDATGADFGENRRNFLKAHGAGDPGACLEQVCGNAEVESGEECDDGNLDETDGCNNDCSIGLCVADSFDSTYDAIQEVIFDSPVYRCTNSACHDAVDPAGDLDLTDDVSFENIVGVTSLADPTVERVFVGEPEKSLLFQKIVGKVEEVPNLPGASMPVGAPAVSRAHRDALRAWIRNAAPRDQVVEGTQADLGTCLPPADPLKIAVPDPPPPGVGVQLQQTPWPLPGQSEQQDGEDEICMATWFDFTGTELIPEFADVACPERFQVVRACRREPFDFDVDQICDDDGDCDEGETCEAMKNATNPDGECFAWHKQELFQDPQSHHSIIQLYTGSSDETDPVWGPWTYKFNDLDDPRNGQPCDPTETDPAVGYNPGCSGRIQSTIACSFYGPVDASNLSLAGGGSNTPQFSGSQEPYYEVEFADTVFTELPKRAMIIWNSHAFNLTPTDSSMSQYLNLEFAQPEDQLNPLRGIFDARWIFVQLVPPFETREYCGTSTLPQGSRLFNMNSHTHQRGNLFRIWLPPNTPCQPECPPPLGFLELCADAGLPICGDPPGDRDPDYVSTEYSDPLQLDFDPPLAFDGEQEEDRTVLFCSVYDNGSAPGSPPVKRFSTSPQPPFPIPGLGGPCLPAERACMDGPNKGVLCNGTDEAIFCETAPGAGDGECDACPLRGGVTTEDEMFINLGNFFIPGI
ncbi:MAG: hypothetical protein O7G30_06300 [Proteobacteria bacterium]|nr:hypothetical protein [Pseudomonadota bacterium]